MMGTNTNRRIIQQVQLDALVPFLFLCTYMVLVLVRPQEWMAELKDLPIIRLSLLLAFFSYIALQKNKYLAPQTICCMALTVIILLSGIRNGWAMGGVQSASDFIISSVLPIVIFSGLATTVKRSKVLMLIAILASLVMVNNGISQKNSPVGIGWSGSALSWLDRITYVGVFNDPNDLGMFFVMTLPFALYFLFQGNFITKCIFSAVAAYILYGVYLTNSRGALVSLVAMAGVFSYLNWGKAKTIITSALLSPGLIFVFMKFRSIDVDEESAAGRVDSWYEGVQLFLWRPVLGIGQGNYLEYNYITAHNSYVLTLAELGFFGYVLWMIFLLLTLYMVYPQRKINTLMLPVKPEKFATDREEELFNHNFTRVRAQKRLSDCLFYSMLGFASTIFFLSRTYAVVGYIFAGIAIAQYYQIAKFNAVALPRLNYIIWRIVGIAVLSIPMLFILIKLLL
ncbi:O-antigen ligase family protein [Rheinheimera baltica]|uniref:O-antigen ligase family protein n=3 Tax=Rheinheimera baltica TaxID=67576 RepID=A0ABT9HU72_9GAMM|nr:O-antigen ligase family protein [Rheinheimera baltica]MDP5134687.1 O-antigen ligase family protein [Rheinheimera baltica]